MLQVNCYISHVTDASSNIFLAEQEWTLWTTNQASKNKIRSRIAVSFLCNWGLPAVSWCWKWFWNQLVPTATRPKLKHPKHHMSLKNASRTGAKVKELLQRWQTPEKNTNGSVLDSKFTTANAGSQQMNYWGWIIQWWAFENSSWIQYHSPILLYAYVSSTSAQSLSH